MTPVTNGTFWLVSDVLRWSLHAPGSGHDTTGPDINLNFPNAQRRCRTGLQSSNVEADRRQTENRPLLESWSVSLHLPVAHTKRVSVAAPDWPCSGTAAWAGTLARLAMNATAVSKSVQTDHVIAYCATNLVRICAVKGKPMVAPKKKSNQL